MTPAATAIRFRWAVILLAMLVAVCGLVAGCGSVTGSGVRGGNPVAVADPPTAVVIKNFAFGPATVAVAPGTKITVVNQDRAPQTLTASNKSFGTGTIAAGQRGEITAPSSPGSYSYICTIHPYMTGTLIVT